MRKQKVGQEVSLAARCHKYLLQSQQYSAAAMTQVTPDALHSVLITIQCTRTVGLSRSLALAACTHAHAAEESPPLLSLLSPYCRPAVHLLFHPPLQSQQRSHFSLPPSPFVCCFLTLALHLTYQGSFQNSSGYMMQIQDLKSSLFIGLNWIFLSFVQTAVIISIKGKKKPNNSCCCCDVALSCQVCLYKKQ